MRCGNGWLIRGCVLALALVLSGPVLAAGFTCAQPADAGGNDALVELEEVVVTGEQPKTRTKDLQAWLKLLVGQYTYEGYVDLCGKGNAEVQRPVTGKADCVGSRSTPTVHCTVNVHWPDTMGESGLPVLGGVSNLLPALVSYSLESRHIPDPGAAPGVSAAPIRWAVAMNRLRVWCVLLAGSAVVASGPLHAQARAPVSKAPRIEKKEIKPCAIRSSCLANPRSRAIALAWESGLDEQGVPLDSSARSRKLVESEFWLRRLAGTFRIEGTYRNYGGTSPVRGTAKCDGVGGGPGVSCVITATWKPAKESVKDPEFDKDLLEAMQSLILRFGMDPATSQVRATLMDFRAVKMRGVLIDDEVAFSGRSGSGGVGAILRYTMASSVVAIEPGGDVAMRFQINPTSIPYIVGGLRSSMGRIEPNLWHEFDLQLHREPSVDAGNPK